MSFAQTFAKIEYPESDGKPMAETEVHLEWMFWIRNVLKHRYRDQRVYVGCNMFVYYVEGDPRQVVAPDGFVVKDCDPGLRRTFKTWEEQRVPSVVFEVTSSSTRREDETFKPETFARIGVKELFLYDPTGDYLDPMLQGFRFVRGKKTRIRADASGALECRELRLLLRIEDGELRMFDARTGKRLLTEAQAERAARNAADGRAKAERTRAKADRARAKAERARAEAAEEEVRRLRDQLDHDRGNAP